MGQVSRYCAEAIRVPHPEREEGLFIQRLLEISDRYPRAVVFPADDETLKTVSKNKDSLNSALDVRCPPWDVVRTIIEKQHTYDLARRLGVPHPRTYVGLPDDAVVHTVVREIGFPCLLKPCESHSYLRAFGRKLVKAHTVDELVRQLRAARNSGHAMMLQEFIPGPDTVNINYNSLLTESGALVDFTAQKVRLSPPESGVPCVVVSRSVPEVRDSAIRLLKGLGFAGYSCMEFKQDPRDGVYKLLEINGRYNRSGLLSVRCGVNFPLMEYMYATQSVTPQCTNWRTGVYWVDLVRDLYSCAHYARTVKKPLRFLLRPYVKPHVDAVFSWTDMRPFAKQVGGLLVRLAAGIFRALFRRPGTDVGGIVK